MTIKIRSDAAGGAIINENGIALGVDGAGNVTSEVIVPSNDNSKKVITSAWAKLNFSYLFAGNGYFRFPDWMFGFTIQWGMAVGNGTVNVTYPIPFAATFYNIQTTPVGSSTSVVSAAISSVTNSGFVMTKRFSGGTSTGDASEPVYWLAIGR